MRERAHWLSAPTPPTVFSRGGSERLLPNSRAPCLATSVLTATTQLDAIGAGITAGAGTGLVLQLLLGG